MGVTRYDPNEPEARRFAQGYKAAAGPGATRQQTPLGYGEGQLSVDPAKKAAAILQNAIPSQQNDYASLVKMLMGGGTSGAASASDSLAKRKYEDELAKEKRTLAAYRQMLSGGGYRSGADTMLEMIGKQAGVSQGAVEDAYKRALGDIGAGYETAQGLTTKGYGALGEFLRANPNNPYADIQVSAGAAPDAMEQILSAYGVGAEPVMAQVAAEQQAAQQGAAGFQNLLNVLGGSAQQSDLSRLAEMEMARTLAGESLGASRASYESQAGRARADALAQIQAQLAQARLEQEASAVARRQQIEDAIAAAGGVVPQPVAQPVPPTATSPAAPAAPVQVGSPGVPGGTPDYLRVIAEQMARQPEPKAAKKKKK